MSLTWIKENNKPIAEVISRGIDVTEILYLKGPSVDDSDSDSDDEDLKEEEEESDGDTFEQTIAEALYELENVGVSQPDRPDTPYFKQVKLRRGEKFVVKPLPWEILYVAGPTGCGKSWWIKSYIVEYMLMFPERRVILLSRHEEDPAYEGLNLTTISLDPRDSEELYSLTVEDLRESLVIFDDCDRLMDKGIVKFVKSLISDTIMNGRKMEVSAIVTTHIVMDGAKTKEIVSQCNKIVVFPGSGTNSGLKRLFEVYLGMSQQEQEHVMRLKGRWVCVDLTAPRYLLSKKEAFMLN